MIYNEIRESGLLVRPGFPSRENPVTFNNLLSREGRSHRRDLRAATDARRIAKVVFRDRKKRGAEQREGRDKASATRKIFIPFLVTFRELFARLSRARTFPLFMRRCFSLPLTSISLCPDNASAGNFPATQRAESVAALSSRIWRQSRVEREVIRKNPLTFGKVAAAEPAPNCQINLPSTTLLSPAHIPVAIVAAALRLQPYPAVISRMAPARYSRAGQVFPPH